MHFDSFIFFIYTELQDIYVFKCVTFDLIQYRVVLINALILPLVFSTESFRLECSITSSSRLGNA